MGVAAMGNAGRAANAEYFAPKGGEVCGVVCMVTFEKEVDGLASLHEAIQRSGLVMGIFPARRAAAAGVPVAAGEARCMAGSAAGR